MMETIPHQLESCRYIYDVCVQKQLKFGMIKGVSFFTKSATLACSSPHTLTEKIKFTCIRCQEISLQTHFSTYLYSKPHT